METKIRKCSRNLIQFVFRGIHLSMLWEFLFIIILWGDVGTKILAQFNSTYLWGDSHFNVTGILIYNYYLGGYEDENAFVI